MRANSWIDKRKYSIRGRLRKMIKCICSGEQLKVDEVVYSSESLATRDYSASGYSSRTGEIEAKVDNGNIEEAESSLRESGYLNYEEARALLGRLEYQKGNTEAALHVFEGIDIAAVTPKIKASISRKCEPNRRRSQSDGAPPMSMHAVSLLLEAVFLKAKSLEALGRFQEAAHSCKTIVDTVESALPEGLPENFASDCKLQETVTTAVELLPELWKHAGSSQEAILSYRKALLYRWNLDMETTAKIEKEFAVFLLYSGCEAIPHALRSQLAGSFVPRNNIEEAVLLLLILMRKFILRRIGWDPSIVDHLSYALTISGEFRILAQQVEELLPGTMERKERYSILALCYNGEHENTFALNLLRNYLNNRENSDCIQELLLASKICGEYTICVEEGINYARKAISELHGKCKQMEGIANCLLGVLLSSQSRLSVSDSDRILKQSEALDVLEAADRMVREKDPYIVFHLCLEHAEQRKLDIALYYAKQLVQLEIGSSVKGYILLARILSAQKRFVDAETVISAALDQTGKWEQGELLRTKAKLQIAQGQLKNAVQTYTHLLAVLQVQTKILGAGKKLLKNGGNHDRRMEMEIWHELANLYTSLSNWRDAEVCLSKSQALSPYSASRWHSRGILYEAKGLHQEALKSFRKALDVEPNHVPSLISTACILRQLRGQSLSVVRSFLSDALRLDRTNPSAWYNLGLLYKADITSSPLEAAECFEAAAILQESAPVEAFGYQLHL
ncbi:tetratricopeptide repeat protein 7A-like [Quillaja saponaria]|uniref:Tetratricopeptide repeat protein 7A-like n=1 Tax=Quillaja saponaria TaxID=32244 RepID=A0AAD7LC41_QUISA|nr:tetratricopeptide repeat protein 7A-like [Quillaja saponaria]